MPDPLRTLPVIQGEYRISDDPCCVLTTILGSCVAACLFDPMAELGGMNHFLLPGADPRDTRNVKYGAHSMEQLINALLRRGAERRRIRAKLFGGANVVSGLTDIGRNNADFAKRFVSEEGFELSAHDLYGTKGRRVRFWPATGRAQIVLLDREPAPTQAAIQKPPHVSERAGGEVDLF